MDLLKCYEVKLLLLGVREPRALLSSIFGVVKTLVTEVYPHTSPI